MANRFFTGTTIEHQMVLVDENGTPHDLSAVAFELHIRKPDGSVVTITDSEFVTDGSDGRVLVVQEAEHTDLPGLYCIQPELTLDDGRPYKGDIDEFEIERSIA